MRVLDLSEYRDAEGRMTPQSRLRGALDRGPGWLAEMDAQDEVVKRLGRSLRDEHVMLQNIPLYEAEVILPMVLISPQGVRVIYPTPIRGLFRARGDDWLVHTGGTERFKRTRPNLQGVVISMAQDLLSFLQNRGFGLPEVEPVLMFTNPHTHVDMGHPSARIVLADAIGHFAANLQQFPAIMDAEEVDSLVNALINPEPTEGEAEPAVEPAAEMPFEADLAEEDLATLDESVRAVFEPGERPAPSGGISVMVVDDDLEARRNVTRVLESAGGIVVGGEAADGLEAIELFERLGPDVVSMKLDLPEMDGLTAANVLCQRHADARIFMHGAISDWIYKIAAGIAGALDYLVTPSSDDELVGTVHKVAEKREVDRKQSQSSVEGYLRREQAEREVVVPRLIGEVGGAIDRARDSVLRMLQICRALAEGRVPVTEGAKSVAKLCAGARTQLAQAICELEARGHLGSAPSQAGKRAAKPDMPEDLISDLQSLLSDADMVLENAMDCLDRWQRWGLSADELGSVIRMWSLCALSELQRVVAEA